MNQKIMHTTMLGALLLNTAHAAEHEIQKPEQCAAIVENVARLTCFDRIYAAPENDSKQLDLAKSYRNIMETEEKTLVFANNGADVRAKKQSPLSRLYDLDNNASGLLTVREHEPMYLMPVLYNSSPNYYPASPSRGVAINEATSQQQRTESKMQISFKTKLMDDVFSTRADLWFAYTQNSNWQLYNQGSLSAPFRNTDYAPELMLTQPVTAQLPWNGQLKMLGVGAIHQSNGRSRPFSRSWNRTYLMAGMEWDQLTVVPRVWSRMDVKGNEDDNPDIMRYMGYGDVRFSYQLDDKHNINGTIRYNPLRNRGALQVGYTFPIRGKLKAYVQGFHGYGENLIDYNHKQTSFGVGLMFNDWDGL